MSPEAITRVMREGLMLTLLLSAGPMLASMVIGLVVSLFQAVTQIQEQSLQFIPKVVGIAVLIVLLGPWMLDQLISYIQTLYLSIPQLVSG